MPLGGTTPKKSQTERNGGYRPQMNFDPQKFFIGLMDFFSILLPGALLTWLLMGEVGPVVLGDRDGKLDDLETQDDFSIFV